MDEACNGNADSDSCLNAFLAAREERPVEFAGAFLALTTAQRMKVLMAVDNSDVDGETEATDSSRSGHAHIVALFDALDGEKASHAREAATMRLPAKVMQHSTLQKHLATKDAADTELEVVELTESETVHAGAMAFLFTDQSGPAHDIAGKSPSIDDSESESVVVTATATAAVAAAATKTGSSYPLRQTAFDNFFTNAAEEQPTVLGPLSRDWGAVEPPALADFLALTSSHNTPRGESAAHPTAGHVDPVATDDPTGESPTAPHSSGEDNEYTIDNLPGLAECVVVSGSAVSEALQALRLEEDSCVHAFALDPDFDYDADTFGSAFHHQQAWRDSDKRS